MVLNIRNLSVFFRQHYLSKKVMINFPCNQENIFKVASAVVLKNQLKVFSIMLVSESATKLFYQSKVLTLVLERLIP